MRETNPNRLAEKSPRQAPILNTYKVAKLGRLYVYVPTVGGIVHGRAICNIIVGVRYYRLASAYCGELVFRYLTLPVLYAGPYSNTSRPPQYTRLSLFDVIVASLDTMDTSAVRAKFPSLSLDQVFLDNAGGSQVLGSVIDS